MSSIDEFDLRTGQHEGSVQSLNLWNSHTWATGCNILGARPGSGGSISSDLKISCGVLLGGLPPSFNSYWDPESDSENGWLS